MTLPVEHRAELAAAVRRHKAAVSEHVTELFLSRHPEMLGRLGDRARQLAREDAGYHLDFLAGAIESGNLATFAQYVAWVVRVLTPRGIPAVMVREHLLDIQEALGARVAAKERAALHSFFELGLERTSTPPGTPEPQPAVPLASTRDLFLQALLTPDRRAAATIIREALRQGHDPLALYADVIQESLYEIGRRWEANQITVAQEHAATAVCQYVLADLYSGTRRLRLAADGL